MKGLALISTMDGGDWLVGVRLLGFDDNKGG